MKWRRVKLRRAAREHHHLHHDGNHEASDGHEAIIHTRDGGKGESTYVQSL